MNVFTLEELVYMNITDFVLVRIIGQGAFGTIWLAKYKKTSKQYALKVVRLKPIPETIIPGINLAININHPNLMKLYGYFYEKDQITLKKSNLIILMEYVRGENLYDKIRNNDKIHIDKYLPQMLDALTYLHNNKWVHRDIKPENIIVDGDKIKIIDYDFLAVNYKLNGRVGTPYYAAPEIYTKKHYDHRVDIWSLGILIWCCIEGREPFEAEDRNKLRKKVLREEPDWSEVDGDKLYPILKGCLAKNPSKRLSIRQIKELIS